MLPFLISDGKDKGIKDLKQKKSRFHFLALADRQKNKENPEPYAG